MNEHRLNAMMLEMMRKAQTAYEKSLEPQRGPLSQAEWVAQARTWSDAANLVMNYTETEQTS